MPLVAAALTQKGVERLLTQVGVLPLPDAECAAFVQKLDAAVTAADLARSELNAGEYTALVAALDAAQRAGEYPSAAEVALTRSLRAKALAIDLALLDAAAHATGTFDDVARERLRGAQLLRRAEAAAETIGQVSSLPVAFISVAPAFEAIATLAGEQRSAARTLLLADADPRAEFAEQLSLALLEGIVLLPQRNTHEIQVGLTTALAKGTAVDPEVLKLIAMALSMRTAFAPASEIAKLDGLMVQALIASLPPAIAHEAISALEYSSPSATRGVRPGSRVMQIAHEASALPSITAGQRDEIASVLSAWKRSEDESVLSLLQSSAEFVGAGYAFSKSMKLNDSQTWPIGESTPTLLRFQQLMAKRSEGLQARRALAKSTRERFEAILGPELWKLVAPNPTAK